MFNLEHFTLSINRLEDAFDANEEEILKAKGYMKYRKVNPKNGKNIMPCNFFGSIKIHGDPLLLEELKDKLQEKFDEKDQTIAKFKEKCGELYTAEDKEYLDKLKKKMPSLKIEVLNSTLELPCIAGKIVPMLNVYDYNITREKKKK